MSAERAELTMELRMTASPLTCAGARRSERERERDGERERSKDRGLIESESMWASLGKPSTHSHSPLKSPSLPLSVPPRSLSCSRMQVTPVPVYQLTAVTLRHDCGAQHVHVARDDPDMAFRYLS